MKKSISILLATICIIGLVGCDSKKNDATTASQQSQSVEQSQNVSKNESSNKAQEVDSKNKEASTKSDNSSKSKEVTTKSDDSSKNKGTAEKANNANNLKENIITKDFNQVSSIQIIYNNSNKTYSIEKDRDFIKKVYDTILNTKVTVHSGRQESEPQFTINLVYKSGDKNVIESTETGQFIYRVLDNKTSWVGGTNTNLLEIIKSAK